ncbi:MAG: IS110 family transposase [Melioribacteraceae bacterium]|jgi:transposase|nr:MAG: IS110 family transposase [Melioribacteraceae bacterium]
MDIIKQVVGIDVSKDTLAVSYGIVNLNQEQRITKPITFDNNLKGFKELISFVKKNKEQSKAPLYFVMEATGVYYENLAYFLTEKHQKVIVVLPNKTKNFSKTLDIKSKTDKLDAQMITQFGLERQMQLWQVPSPIMKTMKSLTREYNSIKRMAAQVKNQLHAKEHSFEPLKESLKRSKATLTVFQKQLKEIEKQLKELVKKDSDLNDRINKIDKIEGVGFMTIVSIIAETNGFALIENTKQLASYAGLDVVYNESGLKKHKTSISKKGNRFLRQAVYMPALSACKHNPRLKQTYISLVIKKNIKKVAIVAVARKLLILIYTIFKKNVDYIPNYNPAYAVNI